jgi:hypothetical protein
MGTKSKIRRPASGTFNEPSVASLKNHKSVEIRAEISGDIKEKILKNTKNIQLDMFHEK